FRNPTEGAAKRRAPAPGERARRQPLKRRRERSRKQSHMKGGITDNGEESQGREEEGRQETVAADLARTKGGHRGPLFNSDCGLRIADCELRTAIDDCLIDSSSSARPSS